MMGVSHSSHIEKLAFVVIVLVIVLSYGWEAPTIISGSSIVIGADSEAGDLPRQAAFIILLALSVYVWSRRKTELTSPIPLFILPLLVWCWLSVLWAIDPSIAFRRISFTTIVIIAVCCCVNALPYERVLAALITSFWIILLSDWLAVLIFPAAIHGAGEADLSIIGDWRGIHPHKNEAGPFCAIALILFSLQALRRNSWSIRDFIPIVLAGVFMIKTGSKTSIGFVLVAAACGMFVELAFRDMRKKHLAILLAVGLVAPLCVIFWDTIVDNFSAFLDDPASLTGRVQIWPALTDYILDHPLLGAGYGSFWGIGGDSPISDYASGWVSELYSAHNGYLELTLQVGVIGLLLVMACLIVYPLLIILSVPFEAGVSRFLFCAILSFCWMRDSLESSMFDRANPTWVVMIFFYCLLDKANRQAATGPIWTTPILTMHP